MVQRETWANWQEKLQVMKDGFSIIHHWDLISCITGRFVVHFIFRTLSAAPMIEAFIANSYFMVIKTIAPRWPG